MNVILVTENGTSSADEPAADGYATRFGLVHVDYTTLKRTPKLSAEFYRAVIARNAPA